MNYALEILENEKRRFENIIKNWPQPIISIESIKAFTDRKRKLKDINEAIEKLKA